ncbi:MAG: DUF452 family protein [Bacteroidetes bacterium]|nr:DUF452 family protein [Bacteroidota bacterium]
MIIHKNISPEKRKKCILFFNGWGMDCNAVKHLQSNDYDVFVCYDYRDLDVERSRNDISTILNSYKETYLIAWSLGVWVAEQVGAKDFSPLQFTKTIAINGTPLPIDNNYGIAEMVFEHTLANWNETNRKKFNARMCGGNVQLQEWQTFMSARSCEEQLQELQQLFTAIQNPPSTSFLRRQESPFCDEILNLQLGAAKQVQHDGVKWTEAIIGSNDLIFTTKNQHNYWQNVTNCRTLPLPHFPFAEFQSWDEILHNFQ